MPDQPVSVGATKGFTLPRDCEVTIVPAGHRIKLAAGDRVTLLQALGGTATVTTSEGEMARLTPVDSIDFGFIDAPSGDVVASDEPFSIDRVWEAATTVYDPEIPVDIYELGLVYEVNVLEGQEVGIVMTLTSPMCPVAETLPIEVEETECEL